MSKYSDRAYKSAYEQVMKGVNPMAVLANYTGGNSAYREVGLEGITAALRDSNKASVAPRPGGSGGDGPSGGSGGGSSSSRSSAPPVKQPQSMAPAQVKEAGPSSSAVSDFMNKLGSALQTIGATAWDFAKWGGPIVPAAGLFGMYKGYNDRKESAARGAQLEREFGVKRGPSVESVLSRSQDKMRSLADAPDRGLLSTSTDEDEDYLGM